jgi:hypothetical protein
VWVVKKLSRGRQFLNPIAPRLRCTEKDVRQFEGREMPGGFIDMGNKLRKHNSRRELNEDFMLMKILGNVKRRSYDR